MLFNNQAIKWTLFWPLIEANEMEEQSTTVVDCVALILLYHMLSKRLIYKNKSDMHATNIDEKENQGKPWKKQRKCNHVLRKC